MVRVSERSYNHSMRYCHVHDLLRDLAIDKAKDDNFLTVCSKPDEEHSSDGTRRLAVHHSDSNVLV